MVRAPDSWLKGRGFEFCRSGGRIFFSRVDFLCWLLFRYPFHPRVTAVAHKRSLSFCQKCRWQVTAEHAYTLRMWLCMKWQGAWLHGVHRTCTEMAAVSRGTSHARTKERYQHTTSVDINNTHYKRIQSLIQNHIHMPMCGMCAVSLLKSRE